MFQLEVLKAKYGDCLILHHGKATNPRHILIDGGPSATYRETLRPRLEELKIKHAKEDAPLRVDLLMVSHIDSDHIGGVNKLFGAWTDALNDHKTPLIKIGALWHNSFPDIVIQPVSGRDSGAIPAGLERNILAEALPNDPSLWQSRLVLESVGEGRTLRQEAKRHAVPVNPGFRTGLVLFGEERTFGDLNLQLLGPSQSDVDALRKEWDKKVQEILKKEGARAAAAARQLDTAVANLSSIVVLAQYGGRSMLLTGDARGDKVLEGLENANLLKNEKVHINLLKWPHHGSFRNFPEKFFLKVTADHHVVSADGQHGNPDLETFKQFFSERPKDRSFTLHMTYAPDELRAKYPCEKLKAIFERARQDGHNFKVHTPDTSAFSLFIDIQPQ